MRTVYTSFNCSSGNQGRASKCLGTGNNTGYKMINYLRSKMIYIFNGPNKFKAYYCNPNTASKLVCVSSSVMNFSSDSTGNIINPLSS